jgi:hypothetical protein
MTIIDILNIQLFHELYIMFTRLFELGQKVQMLRDIYRDKKDQ